MLAAVTTHQLGSSPDLLEISDLSSPRVVRSPRPIRRADEAPPPHVTLRLTGILYLELEDEGTYCSTHRCRPRPRVRSNRSLGCFSKLEIFGTVNEFLGSVSE